MTLAHAIGGKRKASKQRQPAENTQIRASVRGYRHDLKPQAPAALSSAAINGSQSYIDASSDYCSYSQSGVGQ
jgi:hypothetical protein